MSGFTLRTAVQDIMSDSMFTVQSVQASLTTQVARTLLTWIPINVEAARLLEKRLVNLLTKCITPSITSGQTKNNSCQEYSKNVGIISFTKDI